MPVTRDGLLTALESLVDQPIQIGLYTNEPDGDVVKVSDLEEATHYKRVTLSREDWTIDDRLQATSRKVLLPFTGRAGKVAGYFAEARGRVIVYESFMDPIPINTDEDVIKVVARLDAEALVRE